MRRSQSNKKREKPIEDYLVREVKKIGGMSLKWPAVGRRGVPDRICVMPQAGTVFVEVKAPGGQPTKLQAYTMQQIIDCGGVAMVVSSKEEVDQFIEFVKGFGKGDDDVGRNKGGHSN